VTVSDFSPTVKLSLSGMRRPAGGRTLDRFFLRLLSQTIAVQRCLPAVSLTVSARRDAHNGRQRKDLEGSEMIEWE
jgi:hypothetical protein